MSVNRKRRRDVGMSNDFSNQFRILTSSAKPTNECMPKIVVPDTRQAESQKRRLDFSPEKIAMIERLSSATVEDPFVLGIPNQRKNLPDVLRKGNNALGLIGFDFIYFAFVQSPANVDAVIFDV